jgi:hypothetical protein
MSNSRAKGVNSAAGSRDGWHPECGAATQFARYVSVLKRVAEDLPETPIFQTAINPQPPHITGKDQLCFSLQPGHYSSLTAPKLQPTANQGMYNFRFRTLMNTNNASNYQSTNETHYTQENTTITTHKHVTSYNQATKNFTPNTHH